MAVANKITTTITIIIINIIIDIITVIKMKKNYIIFYFVKIDNFTLV